MDIYFGLSCLTPDGIYGATIVASITSVATIAVTTVAAIAISAVVRWTVVRGICRNVVSNTNAVRSREVIGLSFRFRALFGN